MIIETGVSFLRAQSDQQLLVQFRSLLFARKPPRDVTTVGQRLAAEPALTSRAAPLISWILVASFTRCRRAGGTRSPTKMKLERAADDRPAGSSPRTRPGRRAAACIERGRRSVSGGTPLPGRPDLRGPREGWRDVCPPEAPVAVNTARRWRSPEDTEGSQVGPAPQLQSVPQTFVCCSEHRCLETEIRSVTSSFFLLDLEFHSDGFLDSSFYFFWSLLSSSGY